MRGADRPDVAVLDLGGQRHAGRLHPVDSDRLLEPWLVLELDDDKVAGLQHLRRGLGEPALVAVQRGHGEDAGQAGEHGDQGGEGRRTPALAESVQIGL